MTDVFFSYSSKDRERVRTFYDALTDQGFEVFWDQAVPTGTDWDTWIRQHLNNARCTLVFWSEHSASSDNVRHEATIAKQQGKLIPILLDPLAPDQFPMGHYTTQATNLGAWSGNMLDDGWLSLLRGVEAKLAPLWVRRITDRLDAELEAERARRESAERRDRTLREQIAKEAQAHQELRREHDETLDQLAAIKARLETMVADKSVADGRVADLTQQIEQSEKERGRLAEEITDARKIIGTLELTISRLKTAPAKAPAAGAQVENSVPKRPDAPPANDRTTALGSTAVPSQEERVKQEFQALAAEEQRLSALHAQKSKLSDAYECPAIKRFLVTAHYDCRLSVHAAGINFVDREDKKYSFAIRTAELYQARATRTERDIRIVLSSGATFQIGVDTDHIKAALDAIVGLIATENNEGGRIRSANLA